MSGNHSAKVFVMDSYAPSRSDRKEEEATREEVASVGRQQFGWIHIVYSAVVTSLTDSIIGLVQFFSWEETIATVVMNLTSNTIYLTCGIAAVVRGVHGDVGSFVGNGQWQKLDPSGAVVARRASKKLLLLLLLLFSSGHRSTEPWRIAPDEPPDRGAARRSTGRVEQTEDDDDCCSTSRRFAAVERGGEVPCPSSCG